MSGRGALSGDELDYYAETLSLAFAETRQLLLELDVDDARVQRLDQVMHAATARLRTLAGRSEPGDEAVVIDIASKRHRAGEDPFAISMFPQGE